MFKAKTQSDDMDGHEEEDEESKPPDFKFPRLHCVIRGTSS